MKMQRYTAQDIENSKFYQLPKFLFKDPFKKMTSDSKILYTLLKDRYRLSLENNWINEKGQIYLIYTREEMADMLGCSLPTVRKAIKQLIKFKLIEEERQGLNKPNLIYLCYTQFGQWSEKNFLSGVKESFSQEEKNLSRNNTNINKTDYNKHLHFLRENGADSNFVKDCITVYLDIRSKYKSKEHKRVTSSNLKYIYDVLTTLEYNGIEIEEFKEVAEEYLQQLNKSNDGDIVCFLKTAQKRYFDLNCKDIVLK